jgi:hypothetical protein
MWPQNDSTGFRAGLEGDSDATRSADPTT